MTKSMTTQSADEKEKEKMKRKENEPMKLNPSTASYEAVSQSYVLISDSDTSSRKAREALKDPSGGIVDWQLIWDLQRAGRAETARQLFYQRTTRTPSEVALWEQWARFELLQGDQERSRGLYKTALLHSGGDASVRGTSLRKWATMEYGSRNFDESRSLFARCVSVYDDEICGGNTISSVTTQKAADGANTKECKYPPKGEKFKELVSGRVNALHAWATGEARRGNFDEARRLLKLCTNHVEYVDTAADSVDYDYNEDEAKILRSSPYVAHLYASLDESEGKPKLALRKYRLAAEKFWPNDEFILQSYAGCLARVGHVVISRKVFKDATMKFPKNYVLANSFAFAESKLFGPKGDETRARSEFARAARLAPWSVQMWVAWGSFELEKDHIDAAKLLFERAVEAELGNSRALIGLAKCHDKLNNFDACRETLDLAMLSNPENWGVFNEAAKLYEKRGNPAKASHLFKAAKTMGMKSKFLVKDRTYDAKKKSKKKQTMNNKRGTWAPDERSKQDEQAQIAVDQIRNARYARRRASSNDPVVKYFDASSSSDSSFYNVASDGDRRYK